MLAVWLNNCVWPARPMVTVGTSAVERKLTAPSATVALEVAPSVSSVRVVPPLKLRGASGPIPVRFTARLPSPVLVRLVTPERLLAPDRVTLIAGLGIPIASGPDW